MDIKKLNPWNWFKHETERQRSVPVQRGELAPTGFESLFSLHQELDRAFDNIFRAFGMSGWPMDTPATAMFRPRIDIDATDRDYRVTIEVPGVEEKDLNVELCPDRVLRISGERKQIRESDRREQYRVERSYGAFERLLSLPEDVDENGINATFKHGVLDIRLPRKAGALPAARRIEVRSDDTPALKHVA